MSLPAREPTAREQKRARAAPYEDVVSSCDSGSDSDADYDYESDSLSSCSLEISSSTKGGLKDSILTVVSVLMKDLDEAHEAAKLAQITDTDLDSTEEPENISQELESNLEHLTSRLMTAKNRNDNLNAELLGLQLKYSDPLSERRLQHQCDEMETKLHKLNLLKDVDGEKGE